MKVKSESEVAQLCPTLRNPMDCSLPGSSVHGFLQAEYWSRLPFPSPGDLLDPGIEPGSPAFQVAQRLKHLPAMQGTWVQSLGQEDPLDEEMATHFSILAWKFHGQRRLVGYSPWGYRVGHD